MATRPIEIIKPQLLTDESLSYFTCGALETIVIKKLGFFNAGTAPCEVFVYLVKKGELPDAYNQIAQEKIAAKQRYEFFGIGEDVMSEGDTIRAKVTTGATCNIRGSANRRIEN